MMDMRRLPDRLLAMKQNNGRNGIASCAANPRAISRLPLPRLSDASILNLVLPGDIKQHGRKLSTRDEAAKADLQRSQALYLLRKASHNSNACGSSLQRNVSPLKSFSLSCRAAAQNGMKNETILTPWGSKDLTCRQHYLLRQKIPK